MSEWQPIETARPEHGDIAIGYDEIMGVCPMAYDDGLDVDGEPYCEPGWMGFNNQETWRVNPTLWQPLPPPPTTPQR